MKKTLPTYLLLIVFSLTFYISSCDSSQKQTTTVEDGIQVPSLLDRETKLGPETEYQHIQNTYQKAISTLKKNPNDLKPYLDLASVYIMEGRITGNTSYYNNAAIEVLEKIEQSKSADKSLKFQALDYQSVVMLNMHQFKDALAVAKKAVAMYDYHAGIYGALVDANVELGNYSEAVKMCDKMLTIRPDLRSYSRASYLRQINGDNQGAIKAMNMAVEAGYPGMEDTEWARVNLGDLLLQTGEVDKAEQVFKIALENRPGYPYANIGLAKVEKARSNYKAAIAHTESAIRTMGETAFIDLLADLYELEGDKAKAKEIRDDIVTLLEEAREEEPENAKIKHNGSRELAMAYMKNNELDKALEYATTDLKMRADNIDANELVAWIYYLKGDYAEAKNHADKMLSTNVKNANTLYKASMIYQKAGDSAKASRLMTQAKQISPFIDGLLADAGV